MWIDGYKGYRYPRVRGWCERRGIIDMIPQRSDQIECEGQRGLNRLVYRGRNVVERTMGISRRTAASPYAWRSSPAPYPACSSSPSSGDTSHYWIRQTRPKNAVA